MTVATIINTDLPPMQPATKYADHKPDLIISGTHAFCPGCGEPVGARILVEVLKDLGLAQNNVCVLGVGCYTALSHMLDVEIVQAMHGRAPSVATGVKRMKPDAAVYTIQGDGDMVNEGIAEIIHTAARGENVTAILFNNGVFGETGGQMSTTSVVGQRTKTTLEGRTVAQHGHPIRISELLATLDGAAYVARGAVNTISNIAETRKMIRRAFETQMAGKGFSIVEILTMCPTGWFISANESPTYLSDTMGKVHVFGELKVT